MKFLKRNEIDTKKWDFTVQKLELSPYLYSHYLDATTSKSWNALVWEDYESILPFYSQKKWNCIPYGFMPPFLQLIDTSKLTEKQKNEACQFFKKNFLRMDIRSSTPLISNASAKYNYELSLDKTYNEIHSNYNSLLKKNLSKFKEISIENTNFELEYLQYYFDNPFFNQAFKNNRFFLFNFLMQLGDAVQYYKATYEGELIALLITYKSSEREFLIMPISTDIGKKYQAMSFLIDYVIQNSMSKIVDFEGSSIPNIANFYEQFGAKKTIYYSNTFRIF